MKHAFEIFTRHQKGYSLQTIKRNYHYSTKEILKAIKDSENEIEQLVNCKIIIQTEQFYIIESKLNYLL